MLVVYVGRYFAVVFSVKFSMNMAGTFTTHGRFDRIGLLFYILLALQSDCDVGTTTCQTVFSNRKRNCLLTSDVFCHVWFQWDAGVLLHLYLCLTCICICV